MKKTVTKIERQLLIDLLTTIRFKYQVLDDEYKKVMDILASDGEDGFDWFMDAIDGEDTPAVATDIALKNMGVNTQK